MSEKTTETRADFVETIREALRRHPNEAPWAAEVYTLMGHAENLRVHGARVGGGDMADFCEDLALKLARLTSTPGDEPHE